MVTVMGRAKMNKFLFAFAGLVVLTGAAQAAAPDPSAAGRVTAMSGTLLVQRADGTAKALGPNSEVLAGDVLTTQKDSFAQIKMSDGGQMTLRPHSVLKIEQYQFKQDVPKADSALFRLLKGGFRAVTGLIGKRGDLDAYRIRAATATIGIRGTDFSARLCANKACTDEAATTAAAPARQQVVASPVVGRVMLVQGELSAKDKTNDVRKLLLGAPVYQGDTLTTGKKSHAVVALRDEGRVSLQENTVFQIEKFAYDRAKPETENIALRLFKGGARVLTGLIGKVRHDNYRFSVATATIGIRGTGFDAWCHGPCAEGGKLGDASPVGAVKLAAAPGDLQVTASDWYDHTIAQAGDAVQTDPLNGAGVYVWQGEVVLVSPGASLLVALNQAAIIANATGKPVPLLVIPQSVLDSNVPRPDKIKVDMKEVFGDSTTDDPGLYVTVHDGHVILSRGDQSIDLGRNETGFADEATLVRLSGTPLFMQSQIQINSSGCLVQ